MPDNKYKVIKRILDENNVDTMSDEKFAKLLEDERNNSAGEQNYLNTDAKDHEVVAPFLNGGCGITGC